MSERDPKGCPSLYFNLWTIKCHNFIYDLPSLEMKSEDNGKVKRYAENLLSLFLLGSIKGFSFSCKHLRIIRKWKWIKFIIDYCYSHVHVSESFRVKLFPLIFPAAFIPIYISIYPLNAQHKSRIFILSISVKRL